MNIYLAGPMSGRPDYNRAAFTTAASDLRTEGHFVLNPQDTTPPGDTRTYRNCMSVDLSWICAHADCIALLPGWEASKGARVEVELAKCLGLEIRLLP